MKSSIPFVIGGDLMKNKIIAVAMVILVICSCLPVLSVSASATGTVNQWTSDMWSEIIPDEDIDNVNLDILSNMYTYDFHFVDIDKFGNLYSVSSDLPTVFDDYCLYYDTKVNYLRVQGNFEFCYNEEAYFLRSQGKYYSFSTNLDTTKYCIVDDINIYNSLLSVFGDNSSKLFYCDSIIKSVLGYVRDKKHHFNSIVPPNGFSKSAIKFYNWEQGPKGKYNIDYWETNLENYCETGLFSDLDIYYTSKNNEAQDTIQHNEDITFYFNIDDFFRENYGEGVTASEAINLVKQNPNKFNNFINQHFKSVHFEEDEYSVLDFFKSAKLKKYDNYTDFMSFEVIKNPKGGQSSEKYNLLYCKFSLKSYYSYLEDTKGGTSGFLTGWRVVHTCQRFDPETGEIGVNKDGLGSDISQSDDTVSRPPTRQELLDQGFDNGYPNTNGNFPYLITIYRNGKEYVKFFLSKKPSVSSNFYSSTCIDYGVNVNNLKCYIYFKEQNVSKLLDFTNKLDDSDYYYSNENIFNADILGNHIEVNNPFYYISESAKSIMSSILNVDTSEFSNTYTIHLWTNYTGKLPNNYNGFYCTFNWDLENSGHFQKNNSDDNYDYSQDYVPDDGFTDNNGNTHGGAVDPPTEPPNNNSFGTGDFDFNDNTLWSYANQFLSFAAKCFAILPSWIWLLIASSIVIIIVLRVLGR